MTDVAEVLVRGALIGVGGAALMDVWALVARRAFDVGGLDYALLGRWIGHFPRGHFFHDRIAAARTVRGEGPLGWLAHYSIGDRLRAASARDLGTGLGPIAHALGADDRRHWHDRCPVVRHAAGDGARRGGVE